jgi:beta-glucanase (GH16 family)
MKSTQAGSRLVVTGAVCLAVACHAVTSRAGAQVPNLPGWDLVWNDEFDAGALDTARWEALDRKDSFNNEKQYYLPDQVSVANGLLTITATDQPLAGKAYRSGLVRTWAEQTYGRWEVRADLPTTQGMWPAIWLLPKTVNWPLGGEIDIMENRGSEPFKTSSAYHWNTVPNSSNFVFQEYTATQGGQPVNFQAGMHTYAVEWEADQIRYFVDDNLHFTVNNPQAPLTVPMSLIINLAVGGSFGGDPDASTVFPQNFDIDYVRVWQRSVPLQGDVNGDGFVGIADLNVVLGNWNASAVPDPGVLLSDFSNFNLTGTYSQWNSGTFSSGATGLGVQANDFGGGWYDLPAAIDAAGETTLRVGLDVNPGNVADALNIVLIDGDGTERVYRFNNLSVGDNQTLSIDLADSLQDNAVGAVPGLDLSDLRVFHAQGTFANGDPGLAMDLTLDNLSLDSGGTALLQGDLDGDGFVGIADLNIVLGNWNAGTPPTAGVPEPASIVASGLVGAVLLMRRRD